MYEESGNTFDLTKIPYGIYLVTVRQTAFQVYTGIVFWFGTAYESRIYANDGCSVSGNVMTFNVSGVVINMVKIGG